MDIRKHSALLESKVNRGHARVTSGAATCGTPRLEVCVTRKAKYNRGSEKEPHRRSMTPRQLQCVISLENLQRGLFATDGRWHRTDFGEGDRIMACRIVLKTANQNRTRQSAAAAVLSHSKREAKSQSYRSEGRPVRRDRMIAKR